MTVVDPIRDERGWRFFEPDPLNGWSYLSEAYAATDPAYAGRVTVPVLWDTVTKEIVSNSDDDIMRMFEHEFDAFGDAGLELYPQSLHAQIDELNELLYSTVNNGVYRAGFTSQRAYERAAYKVFETLDAMDARLEKRRYLFGDQPLESDWRFFDADTVRRGILRAFQMQSAPHRRLPKSLGLRAGSVSNRRRSFNG